MNVPSVTFPSPEWVVLGLEVVSVQHRVVGLLGTRTNHVESSSDLGGLLNLVFRSASFGIMGPKQLTRCPLGSSPIESLVVCRSVSVLRDSKERTVNQPVEGSDSLGISFHISTKGQHQPYLLHGDCDIGPIHQLRHKHNRCTDL